MAIIPQNPQDFINKLKLDELSERFQRQSSSDYKIPINIGKMKIPKYFLRMKCKTSGQIEKLEDTVNYKKSKMDICISEPNDQRNLESTSDEENTTHDDSKNKIYQKQNRKIIKEDEFSTNFMKQLQKTRALNKKNELSYNSLSKQRQNYMKIYDEFKSDQQQIWIDKINRNQVFNDNNGNNKKGIGQYFLNSTENLALFENSPDQDITYSVQNINNTTNPSLIDIKKSKYLSNKISKSMTSLQRTMAQLNSPKRDFFFTINLNQSQKKDLPQNEELKNVGSLDYLDEDFVVKNYSNQISTDLSNKNNPVNLPLRSKSVIVKGQNYNNNFSAQKVYTPVYKKAENENFSQSYNILTTSNDFNLESQYFDKSSYDKSQSDKSSSDKSSLENQHQQQSIEENSDNSESDEYKYSYHQQKVQVNNRFSTPIKSELKEGQEEADNKIIRNMKTILQKYQKLNTQKIKTNKIKQDINFVIINDQEDIIKPKLHQKQKDQKTIFDFLQKKQPQQQKDLHNQIVNSVTKQQLIQISHPKNQALLNSKIMEKLNNFQKDVSNNQIFYEDTRGFCQKHTTKSPQIKSWLTQLRVDEIQMKAMQQLKQTRY